MQAYLRRLKLRLAWWITWWSLCVIGSLIQVAAVINIMRFPYFVRDIEKISQTLWLIVFAYVAIFKVPSKKKLLLKDAGKDIIYAKAVLLEIKLKEHKNKEEVNNERNDIAEKIKAMQKELDEINSTDSIHASYKNK